MRRLDRTPSSHATNTASLVVLYAKKMLRQGRGGALQRELSRTAALLKMHPPFPPAISPFASMGQQPAVLPLCLDKSMG